MDLVVTFDEQTNERTNKLSFWLARYSIDGQFQEFKQLAGELSPCPIDMQ